MYRHLPLLCCGLLLACGNDPGSSGDDDTAEDATAVVDSASSGGGPGDTGAGPDTGAWIGDGGEEPDNGRIGRAQDSGSSAACDFDKAEVSDCGYPCMADKECLSDACIPTRTARVCSTTCSADAYCPHGWSCRQIAKEPDVVFACVDLSPNLGRPCRTNLDCALTVGTSVVGLGDLCIPAGDAGAFCGRACSGDGDCPAGFACEQVKDLDGKATQQCVATKADDNCTSRFVADKETAITDCKVSNELGSCAGKRWCEEYGLTDCSAAVPAKEKCDGEDNDCDGAIDDLDKDASCFVFKGDDKCPGTPVCIGGVEQCIGAPPAPEACNGVDDDCDGQTDEGCDDDKDGYCDQGMLVDPGAQVCVKGGGDCKDNDAGVNPGQKEVCNGVDDNCDGLADAADPLLAIYDKPSCAEQAGVCKGATKPAILCQQGKWLPCDADTYTQHSPFYSPKEICDDKDNDCSGAADEGCDADKDGYCAADKATVGFPLVCPKGGGDCNDELKSVHPGGQESCDDADNDCNGSTDDGCDDDGDGWCDDDRKTFGGPKVCPKGGGDCDDLGKLVHPKAVELCNHVDDDCDGQTDEPFAQLGKVCTPGKGACSSKGTMICAADGKSAVCSVPAGHEQVEICDDKDNDCDGKTDEGCDDDGDQYCDLRMATLGAPKSCAKGGGDCDDDKPGVNPGAAEACDGVDDDCDGKTDGKDGDLVFASGGLCDKQKGVCKGSKRPLSACVGGKWQACDDKAYTAWHPLYTKEEICDNADNDCDGQTDEGCDDDKDGYCDKNAKILGFPTICKLGAGDCDDDNGSSHPFALEICDGKDNDCDGQTDEKCDQDFDKFCDAKRITIGNPAVCPGGGGDCDDSVPQINPGAKDVCGDLIDQDCKKGADQGCPPTILGFSGVQGPDYTGDKLLQCAGYHDTSKADEIPPGWGLPCALQGWNRIRIACGAGPQSVRWVEMQANPFRDGVPGGQQAGVITGSSSNFKLGNSNLIVAIGGNPNSAQSWWVSKVGCGEQYGNLIVNHPSCQWEANNCFGQNLSGPRYLFVYVGR